LILITKQEKQFLIKKSFLKCTKGRFPDLHIACNKKKSHRKKYYIPDYYRKNLKGMTY